MVGPALLGMLAVASQGAAAQNVTDVVLKSGSFLIPFNIGTDGARPREVQLYMASAADPVSTTQHATDPSSQTENWRLLDRQAPGVGQFQVSKTPDGTFWFAIRTIDAVGRSHPAGPIEAELKVIVDTTNPVVELTADADADGKLTATFAVDDATEPSQMTAYYVTDTNQQWQTVTVERTAEGGKFAFEPAESWRQLSLRLRVIDAAGNETIVVKDRIQKPRIATTATTRFASGPLGFGSVFGLGGPAAGPSTYPNLDQSTGPGNSTLAGNSPALPPPSTADQISNDFGRSSPKTGNSLTNVEAESNVEAEATAPESLTSPTGRPETPLQAMRPLDTPANTPHAPSEAAQPKILSAPATGTTSDAANGNASASQSDDLKPQTPFFTETIPTPAGEPPEPSQLNQPEVPKTVEGSASNEKTLSPWSPIDSNRSHGPSRRFSTAPNLRPVNPSNLPPADPTPTSARESRRPPVSAANALDLERLSQRAVVRYSLSHQFSLDYEIEAIGGRGVDGIELYGTTDGGQTWKKWGDDPDNLSPFDIETGTESTSGEGIFGFQIVVVASNGLSSPRPLPGDAPDIVVVVDETLPEVGLTGAKYGVGDQAGSLIIAYTCEDQYLTSRPITLSFSDSVSGPWTTIAAGLRDTGSYVWPADPQLPRQIYLRIDAIDQADNVGSYVLEDPIDTQGLAPRARIRAFRSITGG